MHGDVVHAAEEFVERAVIAAERSLALRLGQHGLDIVLFVLRLTWILAILSYFAFGIAVLVTRYYLLPNIDEWRPRIEAAAAAALQSPASVGRIEADWQGLNPHLMLRNVVVLNKEGGTALTLPQVDVVLSWTTFLAWQPRLHSLTILAPEIEIKRLRDRRYTIAGILVDPEAHSSDTSFVDWVLAQRLISVRDARVHFIDESAAPAPGAGPAAADLIAAQAAAQADVQAKRLDFTQVNFLLTRHLTGHQFALQLQPPAELAGQLDLRGVFRHSWTEPTARMTSWSGELFAQLDYADLARLDGLAHFVPEPARLDRARGAVRTWVDFSALQVTRLRADVALTGVDAQLRPGLQALRLDSVRGRITNTSWSDEEGETREIVLGGLQLDGPDGLHLPATDLLLRITRSHNPGEAAIREQTRLEANRIVLSDWSRLAEQVPLPANWRELIGQTAARGTIEDLRASWSGPATPPINYALHGRFSGLGFSLARAHPAQETPAEPGPAEADPGQAPAPDPYEFENLAGVIDLNQESGSLRLDANDVRLRLPGVFEQDSLALQTLATRLRWRRGAEPDLAVDVDSFSAANPDLDLGLAGSYRRSGTEPERIDFSGRLPRARVEAVYRYLPRIVAAPARQWIEGALQAGEVSDGSFHVRGDPARFPFADPANGEFHAVLHVRDARLEVAPAPVAPASAVAAAGARTVAAQTGAAPSTGGRAQRWPVLDAIDGDVVFDQDRLVVSARRAKAYGYEITGATARIAHLDQPDQHLFVDGQGYGPLQEMLRYLGASPVNAWTGGWLSSSQASGPARLRLRLEVPLAHSIDSTVTGTVNFRGNALVLRPDIAPFSSLNGQLDFNERGIRLTGISAGYIGGEVHLSGNTLADGTLVIRGDGSATPQGVKKQVDTAIVQRLLDHMRGSARYAMALTVKDARLGLRVDSDLAGLAADLPEPFRKTAGEIRFLRVEDNPVAGASPGRDALRVIVGTQLSVDLRRLARPDNSMHIERGIIGIGAHPNVPEAGVLLMIDQPNLDVDRWQRLLALGSGAAPGGAGAGTPATTGTDSANAADTNWIDQIIVKAGEVTVGAKSIHNVSLSAKRGVDGWLADIDSDQAVGSLHWADAHDASPARLTARLTKLAIPEHDQKQGSGLLDTPPTEFPALDIVADQFEVGASKLGHLEVVAQSSGNGPNDTWSLQKLTLENPDGKFAASGAWQREDGLPVRTMSVKVSLEYANAGNLLARFGYPGAIKNASGKLEGDLSWRGAPFTIDYPSLAGKLHLAADKGQFLKVDAGAGRLLGVLSLQSLAHRITGDFRDVFSAGFAFDSLSASAAIANGKLTTDDFIMKGVNAAVRVKGSADLNAETQNLQVVVIPEINADAALFYTLINPAIGLGTFVANYLLKKPLSAAFTNVYEITGSWSDPQVKPVKNESKTVGAAPVS